jgi:SAM-dependent methyltransferase
MDASRRCFLRSLGALMACVPLRGLLAAQAAAGGVNHNGSTFRYIYGNEVYRGEFRDFLTHVFHLYPEDELHRLIAACSQKYGTDRDIYIDLQQNLDRIKPFLSELSYALPALTRQKNEMASQTRQLLPDDRRYENYLEVGSNGRYLDALEERFEIVGERFTVSEREPTYSLTDMIDRGQIFTAGEYIALDDYQAAIAPTIPSDSIDLATVYIGFHHCPPPLREAFIGSIREVIKPDGYLILRDHNAHDEKMWNMVALAHDVFNMGTAESWEYNAREQRHFYSLDELDRMLVKYGFRSDGRRLFQDGDPTLNALMLYRKA